MNMDAKIEYLKMIQAIISRLSNYGFLLKGWGVTLLAAILALSSQSDKAQLLLLVGLFPVFVFWMLDGFFLMTETKFRALYDQARVLDESKDGIDFNMTLKGKLVDKVKSFRFHVFSKTLRVFWIALLVVLFLSYMVINCCSKIMSSVDIAFFKETLLPLIN